MSQDELTAQFCAITNCDSDRAKFFLASANWQLEPAINTFFAEPLGGDEEVVEPVEDVVTPPAEEPGPTLREIAAKAPKKPAEKPRFGTIGGFSKDESDSDSDNDYYAGGSERSGQMIRDPEKAKKLGAEAVFNSAKEHGAQVIDEGEGGSASQPSRSVFGGSGFRLGSEEGGESAPIANPSAQPMSLPDQHSTITFWQGGFSIDNGPLRKMDDPANKEFLDSVMKGEIPRELVREARGAEVHVKMVDKRTEEFQAPKVVIRPFSGSGFKLGSPVPTMVSTPPARSPTNPPTNIPTVNVDQGLPITTLQIRLSDGTRLVTKFNHTHTVSDIRNFINLSRPGVGTNYALMTTFPSKELSEEQVTIADAGLLNAVIVQRNR